jgi:AcrR family transcriptional regulator
MAEQTPDDGTRDRIVRAAIACIEREGLERASVRRIAQEAGVNVAAINYHFGTKEALIAQVRELTLRAGFSDFLADLDALTESGVAMRRAFPQLVEQLVADALGYPRIAYAHLRDVIVDQDYRSPVAKELTRFLEQLLSRVAPLAPRMDAARQRLVLGQIWSNLLLLGLAPRLLVPFTALELSNAEDRRRYVRVLLAPLLEE